MENFVNNWRMVLTLSAGATSLAVSLPDGIYRLTARDADSTRWEIMRAQVASGTATLERGIEGTADQEWPSGSVLYQSITAGTLEALAHSFTGQGDPNGVLIVPAGSHYLDNDSAAVWFCVYSDETAAVWERIQYQQPAFLVQNNLNFDFANDFEMLVGAGVTLSMLFSEPVYSNVTLAGTPRAFTTTTPVHARMKKTEDGAALIVTPVQLYT